MAGSVETQEALGLVIRALGFASKKHRDQRRKDREASPYINHPIDLAGVLATEAGVFDPRVIAAAVLHDTVEDTDATLEEIEREFGAEVSGLVAEVTDDRSLPKAERKRLQVARGPKKSFGAQQIKMADKIANLRDIASSPPHAWSLERRREYFDWAKAVIDGMRGRHATLETIFDEAYAKRP